MFLALMKWHWCQVVVTCSGRLTEPNSSFEVGSSSDSALPPLLELSGGDTPVRGIRQLSASNIEALTHLACAAVTEGKELLLWDSCIMASGGEPVIPVELFAGRGDGAAHTWYLSEFKARQPLSLHDRLWPYHQMFSTDLVCIMLQGNGVVASCYVDRLHTYVITKVPTWLATKYACSLHALGLSSMAHGRVAYVTEIDIILPRRESST
eukprot:scaffold64426_cov42-Prasinocladus_malaysianus.AAC.1